MPSPLTHLKRGYPVVAAHRGASRLAPENTLSAFEKALSLGAEAVELDVQMTLDRHLVVFHDGMLERTTNGSGRLKDHTLAALRSLDAGSWFSPEYGGEPIAHFDEVLSLTQGRAVVNIELKPNDVDDVGFETKIVAEVRNQHMEQDVVFTSFDHVAIYRIKRIAPDIAAIITCGARLVEEAAYAKSLGADGCNHSILWWTQALSQQFATLGLVRHGSLINEPSDFLYAKAIGLDLVDSDEPMLYGRPSGADASR